MACRMPYSLCGGSAPILSAQSLCPTSPPCPCTVLLSTAAMPRAVPLTSLPAVLVQSPDRVQTQSTCLNLLHLLPTDATFTPAPKLCLLC